MDVDSKGLFGKASAARDWTRGDLRHCVKRSPIDVNDVGHARAVKRRAAGALGNPRI